MHNRTALTGRFIWVLRGTFGWPVQGMVVALATDKAVWEAVLANEKIQEFRRNFNNELKGRSSLVV